VRVKEIMTRFAENLMKSQPRFWWHVTKRRFTIAL